jgi:hypothetical protein
MNANTPKYADRAGNRPQVDNILARSVDMIQKVNATLRSIQAGIPPEDVEKTRENTVEQTRAFNHYAAQLNQVTRIPATTTLNSPSYSSQGSPSSSSGPTMNVILSSTVSPKKFVPIPPPYLDEGNGIEGDIASSSSKRKSSGEEVEYKSHPITVDISETEAQNVSNVSTTISSPLVITGLNFSNRPGNLSIQNVSKVSTTISSPLVITGLNFSNRPGSLSVDIIKERLAKHKRKTSDSSYVPAGSGSDTSQPAKKLVRMSPVSVQSHTVATQAAPQNQIQIQSQPSPVTMISTPLNTVSASSAASANSPVDELAPFICDPDSFMNRFFDLSNEQLNTPTSQNGQTLFELALRANSLAVVELLLGAGFFSVKLSTGESALSWAIQNKHSELVRRLMSHSDFQAQVNMFVLGAARYDLALVDFLRPYLKL